MSNTANTEISVKALQSGDRSEFARFVDAYSPQIYRLALKMLGQPQDAEDVLQNTFIKAFQHIPNFEGRSSISTWLYRIAANEALMMIRKRRPETALMDLIPENNENEENEPANLTDWCCLPEAEFLNAEARTRLDQAVQLLPDALRIVFLLRDIEGLSIEETSQALNLSETAVKTRLLRARLRLREDLSNYYGERVAQRRKP
jgi:RNA polymerase sigma-70 factor (ECF subfamily)